MPPSILPKFVVVQGRIQMYSAFGLGLALLIIPDVVHSNPIANALSSVLHSGSIASPSDTATNQLSALAGIFCSAIGLAYALADYHGYDEWLYISIPGRLWVSGFCLGTWILAPDKMSPLLLTIMVWDGACAAIGGYLMGGWSGKKSSRATSEKME